MSVKPLLCVFVVAIALSRPVGAAEPCLDLPADAPAVRLAGIDQAGDPLLADGRALRLVGIAPRQDTEQAARFALEVGRWRDRDLRLVAIGPPDRWGRQPARLLIPADEPGAPPRDLALVLIGAGAASTLPEAAHAGCGVPARSVKAAPARAAPAKAGETIIDGHDVAALKVQAGRLVALEGRIVSVGERAQRTYLNFSQRRAEAGSIVMSRKLWRELQDAGWTAAGLSGKRVRARGVLSGQDGLLLEATSALALELID